MIKKRVSTYFNKTTDIAPLGIFRAIFGAMMLIGLVRFALYDWIHELYIQPDFHFSYFGFEWLTYPTDWGIYLLFIIAGISSLLIALGLFYKYASVLFLLSFTYIELLDRANYLNHYYFISCMALILVLLPANRSFSLDTRLGLVTRLKNVPKWNIDSVKLMIGLVYFFAGISKLNTDWLLNAEPLAIWLPQHADLPVIGSLLAYKSTAFVMSWGGAIFDLAIPFLLLNKKTVLPAYLAVSVFHLFTGLLFPIGIFPLVMMASTLVFFPTPWHRKIVNQLSQNGVQYDWEVKSKMKTKYSALFLVGFFTFQLIFPFRFLLYPDNLFWAEEGYRFSWRVMLMEKAGKATFYVHNPEFSGNLEVRNGCHLTPNQEKMMSTQPDLILQYAAHLKAFYEAEGVLNPEIRANIMVTLNGSGSRLFVDPEIDLSKVEDTWHHKTWVLPFENDMLAYNFTQINSRLND
ncbi:MAG: hypothetical protein ACJAV7_000466 [Flavobacteriales bacterium]